MRKSNNIKQILRQSTGTDLTDALDHDELFTQYEKNLFTSHKVPKVKIHQAKYW